MSAEAAWIRGKVCLTCRPRVRRDSRRIALHIFRTGMTKFTTVVVAAVLVFIGQSVLPAPVAAQDRLAVVTTPAPIYLLPDLKRIPLRILDVREYLRVRRNEGEWLWVDFQDVQFGVRTGYIQAKFVQLIAVERDEQSELVTVDLGLKAPIPRKSLTESAAARRDAAPARTTASTRGRQRE